MPTPLRNAARPPLGRDHLVDFWRGIALVSILIGHLRGSWLHVVLLRTWSPCSMADVFFFLSGFVAALVYLRKLETEGVAPIWRRWRRLYVVQVLTMWVSLSVLLGYGLLAAAAGDGSVPEDAGYDPALSPANWLLAPTLLVHLRYNDILPVYLVLLLCLPLILFGMRSAPWATLGVSLLVWCGAVAFPSMNLPLFGGGSWSFNPFFWQFIFCLGAFFGALKRRDGRLPRVDGLWVAATAGAVFLLLLWHLGVFPDVLPAWMLPGNPGPLLTAALQPLYLVLLAVVVRHYIRAGPWLETAPVRWVRCAGRNSLEVFAFHVVLVYLLQTPVKIFHDRFGWLPWFDIPFFGLAVGCLLAFALFMEARKMRG